MSARSAPYLLPTQRTYFHQLNLSRSVTGALLEAKSPSLVSYERINVSHHPTQQLASKLRSSTDTAQRLQCKPVSEHEEAMGIKTLIVGVGAACAAIGLAPIAHADYTWTVQQICAAKGPNLVPAPIFASPDIACVDPAYWQKAGTAPGLFIAAPPSIPRTMADLRPGSYSTDPGNPWADWIIPEGSQPKPPPSVARITEACDRINGQIICGPQIPIPCSGPGAPCG